MQSNKPDTEGASTLLIVMTASKIVFFFSCSRSIRIPVSVAGLTGNEKKKM